MSLSSAERRELAAIEQELAEDRTLTVLAARLKRSPWYRKRFRLPLPGIGWTVTLLLSGLGIALLIAGVLSGKPGGIAAAAALALLLQLPVVALAMLTRGGRRRR